jgi:hypothetical protein
MSVKEKANASAVPRYNSFVLTDRPVPTQHSSDTPRNTANGMDYTFLCSHGTDDEQKEETTKYYKNLSSAEELLKALPDAFKELGEGILFLLLSL